MCVCLCFCAECLHMFMCVCFCAECLHMFMCVCVYLVCAFVCVVCVHAMHILSMCIQLDLGYPAISYPDISIIRPRSCSLILSISNYRLYSLAQDKNKVVKYCICFILLSNPLNMSDNLLQIE